MDESITNIDFTNTLISVAAFILALYSLYLQHKVKGPLIELLNAKDIQRRVPRRHEKLPKDVQEHFPDILDAAPGYALVKLIFGNSGDRVGIAISHTYPTISLLPFFDNISLIPQKI